MRLEDHEVERFYQIWFPLLHYVNRQKQLVPTFPAQQQRATVDPNTALSLRDALWANDSLREGFIAENPAHLSPADIALVESWKHRVSGSFIIFRCLKKYTIFLSEGSPVRAYGVLGLVSSFKEMFGAALPIYAEATLLPFEGRIIYDSLLRPYSIYFGGGYRQSFADSYRGAQEREGIITTLLPNSEANRPENIKKTIRERNQKLLRVFQKELGRAGLSPKMMEQHTGNIASFAEGFLLSAEPPRGLVEMTLADIKTYLCAEDQKATLVSFKRFARFLRDTDRMDYQEAEDLLKFLKRSE